MGVRWIHKVGAAVVRDGRLLVVRKRGLAAHILPGGKAEGDETDLEALARELDEELGCGLASPELVGVFKDRAAGTDDAVVVVRLYAAELVGEPRPSSEIEAFAWVPLRGRPGVSLAPSISQGVLPSLRRRARGGASAPAESELQGAFELV